MLNILDLRKDGNKASGFLGLMSQINRKNEFQFVLNVRKRVINFYILINH